MYNVVSAIQYVGATEEQYKQAIGAGQSKTTPAASAASGETSGNTGKSVYVGKTVYVKGGKRKKSKRYRYRHRSNRTVKHRRTKPI